MKSRVSKQKASELERKKWKRKFRQHVADMVVDHYLKDEFNPIHADDFLRDFVEHHTGTKNGANMMIGFLSPDLNDAMKQGIKIALKDGVPGILVTQPYFDDMGDDPDKLSAIATPEEAARYVAGAGSGGEGVGVLYVYRDESINPFWLCVHNHRRGTMNGLLDRNMAEIGSSVQQKLKGFTPNSTVVKAIRGAPKFKMLK